MRDPDFIKLMKNQFEDVPKWDIKEGYWNQGKRIIDDEVAKVIRRIEETPRARNEAAYKAKRKKIQSPKQNWEGPQSLVKEKIREAQEMAGNARLEITGVARQRAWHLASPLDYQEQKEERGVAMLSDQLQPISSCWMRHGIYRFNQWQQPSVVNWKGNDHEEGKIPGSAPKPLPMPNPKDKDLKDPV